MSLLPPPDPDSRRPNGRKRAGKRFVNGKVVMPERPLLSPAEIHAALNPPVDDTIPDIPQAQYDVIADDLESLTSAEKAQFLAVLAEIRGRECESLAIFEPLPEQERFFASEAPERIALGGNRGGKTMAVVTEIARCATNQDPHDKYGKGGKIILVGRDLTHCSKVFYQNLFKPGAFKVIKDLETGEMRSYRPNDMADRARSREAKDAPPLIPSRFYDYNKDIAWENKKDECPKMIRLNTGWTIYFFSGLGGPPQGWKVALVAFDEEIEHPRWYPEMSLRLPDERTIDPETGKVRNGKFIWAATPQAGTEQLYNLKCRGDECQGDDHPAIENFMFTMMLNPFLSNEAKLEVIEKLRENEDETAVRIHGEFALLGTRVYPEFLPRGPHGCPTFAVPDDWTRYAIVDPGRQVCAVLFVATPPTTHEWRGRLIVYDELYLKRCNAKIFASTFVARTNGHPIQKGIIDHRGGGLTEIGSGLTPEEQYTLALKAERFSFVQGGCTFEWASDGLKAGIEAVRVALHVINGKSRLVVMRDMCPKLCREMDRYSYKRLPNGTVTDEPVKANDHLVDDLRYAVQAKLPYVKPKVKGRVTGYTTAILAAKKERARHKLKKLGTGGSHKVW